MKVLQIIDKLGVGGAERVCVDLSNLLYTENITVSVLTFISGGELKPLLNKNIPIIKYNRKSKFNISSAINLSRILKKHDIIHVHMRHSFRYVKLVSILFNTKSKIFLHDHSSKFTKTPLFLNSLLKPSYFIGVSNKLTDWAATTLNIKKEHIYLLKNIVIKEHTFKKERKGMVIVGNIKPVKNQLFAIRLTARLGEDLTIIGKVQDTKYYQKLKSVIKELGIEKNVKFIFNEKNPQQLLSQFKFGLMVSILESGPLVLIEYVAQNLPFISIKKGEVSQLLEKELPDFFIENYDEEKWIESAKKLSTFEGNLEAVYTKYFSPKDYINKCVSIYQKIINY
ncbi:MAG: glycosyltransferase involved in cell wall biosynthesis [Polaribacter sp.]|jgi:glycosyltransferase involved in cell wall biosynthesis